MSPWKVILATVIIFGTGVLTGGFVTQRAFRDRPAAHDRHARQPDLVPTPHFVRREFLQQMDRHLDLTPQQYERIAKILQDSQERTRIIVGLVSPEIQEELREVRKEIRAELDPEQRKKFEEMQHLMKRRPPPDRPDRRRPGFQSLPERP